MSMYGEGRAEALPADNVGGVDGLFLEQLSSGVSRCQFGGHEAEACQGTDKGERRPVDCPGDDKVGVDSLPQAQLSRGVFRYRYGVEGGGA